MPEEEGKIGAPHLPAGEALAEDLGLGEDGREGPAIARAKRAHRRGGEAPLLDTHRVAARESHGCLKCSKRVKLRHSAAGDMDLMMSIN